MIFETSFPFGTSDYPPASPVEIVALFFDDLMLVFPLILYGVEYVVWFCCVAFLSNSVRPSLCLYAFVIRPVFSLLPFIISSLCCCVWIYSIHRLLVSSH